MDHEPSFTGRRDELLRLLAGAGLPFVDLGDGLGRLEVWSEEHWNAAAAHERPEKAEHVEDLGWLVAVPISDLN